MFAWKAKHLFRNIGEFGEKIFYRPLISLYNSVICCYKRKLFWSILFVNKPQRRGISKRLFDKCCHLFICISLKIHYVVNRKLFKVTWRYQNRSLLQYLNFRLAFDFCSLINKTLLEWFVLIMCKEHTLSRSANHLSRNHPALRFWLRREGRQIPNTWKQWLEVTALESLV